MLLQWKWKMELVFVLERFFGVVATAAAAEVHAWDLHRILGPATWFTVYYCELYFLIL